MQQILCEIRRVCRCRGLQMGECCQQWVSEEQAGGGPLTVCYAQWVLLLSKAWIYLSHTVVISSQRAIRNITPPTTHTHTNAWSPFALMNCAKDTCGENLTRTKANSHVEHPSLSQGCQIQFKLILLWLIVHVLDLHTFQRLTLLPSERDFVSTWQTWSTSETW